MSYDFDHLNYHHLRYFWVVAREGGINRACDALDVAPSTVSTQVGALEASLGSKLFHRVGRRLVLTDAGQAVFSFAEEIFRLGQDLTETLRGRPAGQARRLAVGVADVVPKSVTTQLLAPALALAEEVRLVCGEGKPEELLASLALHRFDVVLLDAPVSPASRVRAHSRRIGRSAVVLLGAPDLVATHRPGLPASLDEAPFLLPSYESALRPSLEQWFDRQQVRPRILGEFDDSALMKAFGGRGFGLLPAPAVAAKEVCRQYGLEVLDTLDDVRVDFFAVTVERTLENPAVTAVLEAASSDPLDHPGSN